MLKTFDFTQKPKYNSNMTLYKTNNPNMDYAVIKRKGKSVVVRMWSNGWFPTHPVKDVDVKAKGWNKEYGTHN